MTENVEFIRIFRSETDDGKVLVATNAAPYFCFEADDLETALKLIKRAVNFFNRAQEHLAARPAEAARSIKHVRPRWARSEERVTAA